MSIAHLYIWSYSGLSFARIASGEFPQWFETETIRQIDPILDSAESFVDIGGRKKNPLQIRAAFDTATEAQAMINKEGSIATLSKSTTGQSAQALLAKAAPVFVAPGIHAVDLLFEATA